MNERYLTAFPSPVGLLTVVTDSVSLLEIRFEAPDEAEITPEAAWPDIMSEARRWLERYFAGEKPLPGELPTRPEGSAFSQAVWGLLAEIPYGQTVTYGDLARQVAGRLGRERMSAQAIGGAVGRNPIPIVLPCHRVVAAGGKPGGFSAGLEKKKILLRHEGASLEVPGG